MKIGNQVKHIRHEQSQPIPGDVKLSGIVGLGHHLPEPQELVPIDVGERADFPHGGRKFAGQKLKHTVMLQFANDNKGSDVVESPAVCGPIQLNGKPAPSLDRPLLSLGFESHEHILPDLLQRPIEGLLELRVRTQ